MLRGSAGAVDCWPIAVQPLTPAIGRGWLARVDSRELPLRGATRRRRVAGAEAGVLSSGRDGQAGMRWRESMSRAPVGASTLRITCRRTSGGGADRPEPQRRDSSRALPDGTLTVAPKFVEPAPEDLARIKAEVELKAKVFAASAAEPLWTGNFRAPVTAAANRQLWHAPHVQRHAGQRSQGDGFSRGDGHAGARRQQRRGGAGAAALLRRQLRRDRPRAGAVHDFDAPEPH